MRYCFLVFLLTLLACACSPVTHLKKATVSLERDFQNHVGFMVYDPATRKTIYEHQSDRYYTPASNTKIFTLYTAMKILGDSLPAFRYTLSNDSLVIWGMADASFLYPEVYQNPAVYQFLSQPSRKVFFSQQHCFTTRFGPGWAWDDFNDYYSTERSPFPIYGNVVNVQVLADGRQLFQPSYFAQHAVTVQQTLEQPQVVRDEDANQFVITPGVQPVQKPFIIPFRYSSDLFGELLADTLNVPVEELDRPLPAHAKVRHSIPADSAYRVMMQESDNFIAEQLLLACAAAVSDSLKPEAAIRYAKKNFLADLPDEPRWVDGSGLSRNNLVTPRSIVRLWEKLYQEIPTSRLFPLLATGGKNGTLRSYFKAEKAYVFGKTGSLSNNHSLSGFLNTRKQRMLIFSIMSNNFVKPTRELRLRMEQILKFIHDNY